MAPLGQDVPLAQLEVGSWIAVEVEGAQRVLEHISVRALHVKIVHASGYIP